jgi:hypothetical protein
MLHASHVTRHTSHVTRHTSHFTLHTSRHTSLHRYASLQSHQSLELSRADDLWSIFYVFIEFYQGDAWLHARVRSHTHARTHAIAQARAGARVHAHAHTHTRSRTHSHTHTLTHSHTRAHRPPSLAQAQIKRRHRGDEETISQRQPRRWSVTIHCDPYTNAQIISNLFRYPFATGLPSVFLSFMEHLMSLQYKDTPDYE